MENITLVPQQYHSITRSFSKKVNLELSVGGKHKYEAEDFFSSHNEAIPLEEATPERVKEISQRLYDLAKEDVEGAVASRVRELKERDGIAVQPIGSDYGAIGGLIEGLEKATTKVEVDAVVELIKAREDLTDTQKEYLRSVVRKATAKAE